MRANEIRTDGTEYVYRWRQWGDAIKVKVVEKTTIPGGPFSKDMPGWVVEVVETSNVNQSRYRVGQRFPAKSRQIDGTWADYEAEKERRDRAYADEEFLRAQREAANSIALNGLHQFYAVHGLDPAKLNSQSIRFTPSQLLALLVQVEKTSRTYPTA